MLDVRAVAELDAERAFVDPGRGGDVVDAVRPGGRAEEELQGRAVPPIAYVYPFDPFPQLKESFNARSAAHRR
ncbi:hypothetical protein, partial [Amycolatopsis eburnea]|uniref:hypothetical protein n=1 Tax=Amycolatopsis eburnea TaxID=2267691 RepID=UPI001CDB7AFD